MLIEVTTADSCAIDFSAAQVRAVLAKLLGSVEFAKAERMRRLMQFLVEARLAGRARELNEYTIGIEVFGRHPANYHTGEDPIVRVQMGRLRERIRMYYAASGQGAELVFSIPVGRYTPEIRRADARRPRFEQRQLLALRPLACLSARAPDLAFARGVSEQLAHQLFKAVGNTLVSHTFNQRHGSGAAEASHVIEGSVRADAAITRVAVRVVDAVAGSIAWSGQFDGTPGLSILLQDQLATAVCDGLLRYFAEGE